VRNLLFCRQSIFRCLKTPILFLLAFWVNIVVASAQSDTIITMETIERAVSIAEKIDREKLIIEPPDKEINEWLSSFSDAEKIRKLRHLAMDASALRIKLGAVEILPIYREEAVYQKSARDIAISEIIGIQEKLQTVEIDTALWHSNLERLRSFRENEDWMVVQRAALMEASLPINQGNYDIALRDTQSALKLIPNELSQDVLEAQFETYDLIAYLHVVLNNIELSISSTESVIEKGLEHNRSIDGLGYINNLNYVFNSWHEFETAEKLAEILFRLSKKNANNFNSIAYYRYAQAQNNAAHYADALNTLDEIHTIPPVPQLQLSIQLAYAVAYAGLGRIDEANLSLQEYERIEKIEKISPVEHKDVKLHIQALMAVHNDDAHATQKISESRLKSAMQLQLSRQSKGIQSLQANLENSQERQTERETALIRESKLRQSELEAKQRSNVFLMALAGAMLFIAFAAIGFAVWRQKISKILKIAAHDAEAGDRAKSQFLSVMSHELRTPLNGIIGIAGILSERGETEELRNYNKLILKSGQNLLTLLSGILDMAQMESDKLQIITAPASIRQIVDGLYHAAKSEITSEDVELTCFVADEIPDDLMLDSLRVKQALTNLISNAVRFTQKGRVHIHVTLGAPGRRGVRDLTMIVADTGQGIADDIQDKLFKPFAQADSSLTRNHDGAGIGLAITRGLSRLMGGDVTMTSKAGRGSEFSMVIKTCIEGDAKIDPETNRRTFIIEPSAEPKIDFAPAVSLEKLRANEAEKERREFEESESHTSASDNTFEDLESVEFETLSTSANKAPRIESLESVLPDTVQTLQEDNPRAGFTRRQERADDDKIAPDQLQGLNILIVEDVAANQEVLRSLLEPVGCDVSCAEHGQKALDMMSAQFFDAVIMDIRMPVLNGIETTKAIRNLEGPHQNVAIIALTADASAENNAECLAAGADVFLTKPVVVSELFSSIRFARRKQFRQKKQALSA